MKKYSVKNLSTYENFQIGDILWIESSLGSVSSHHYPVEVVRFTPKQIVVKYTRQDGSSYEEKFYKSDGEMVGSKNDIWHTIKIKGIVTKVTEE